MRIGAYECDTPFATAGSGSARWCVASRDGQRFFLKQFLSPVRPDTFSTAPAALRRKQRARCRAFERRKKALYEALGCVLGDCVAAVTDFFVYEGRYYAASGYVPAPLDTLETLGRVPPDEARALLYSLARCLGRVHAQGIVHADLKPEHVLVSRGDGRVRLIDFDSGFLEDDPPADAREIDGDPVYLAPEAFLRMTGEPRALDRKIDTFAFGAIAHRLYTGRLPEAGESAYLYEAALTGGAIRLAEELPRPYRWLIAETFRADPAQRPDDATLVKLFAPPAPPPRDTAPCVNGLSRYLRPEDSRLFPPDERP